MATISSEAYGTYDIHLRRPRLNATDVIVLVGALVAFLAGWAIKDWHDNRVRTATFGEVEIAYPRGWLSFPVRDPELFRAVSNDDGDTLVFLSAVTTPQTDVLQAVTTNNANPARDEVGYAQLSNQATTVDGNQAVMTDYTYVRTAIGGTTVPTVIRGRQYAWIKNGQLYTYAIEGPDDSWGSLKSEMSRLVDKVDTGA
jgi:hypothetical protein